MLVNPYDDHKVSLRRLHGNGDLDIVRALYTRRKANVTEALTLFVRIKFSGKFPNLQYILFGYVSEMTMTSMMLPQWVESIYQKKVEIY